MVASRPFHVLVANPGADLYGSDRMVLESVTGLVGRGYRVTVTSPRPGPLWAELEARGARVAACPSPVITKAALSPRGALRLAGTALRSVVPALRLLRRERPDLVLLNTITAPGWLLAARTLRIATACHVHEGEASARPWVLRLLYAPLHLAQRLVVNSRFSEEVMLRSAPRLRTRSTVVHNAVAGPAHPTPARETLDGPVRLVFTGRLSVRKGPQVAIRALAELRDRGVRAQLALVGEVAAGNEPFRRELEDLVSRLQLEDAVTFHGFQPSVWPFLAAADIALVPSTIDEPFGNTAVEAQLAARPLVVSAISGLVEATTGAAAIQATDADSPGQLAAAVHKIIDDWDHYREAARRDADRAQDRYSNARYADGLCRALGLDSGLDKTPAASDH